MNDFSIDQFGGDCGIFNFVRNEILKGLTFLGRYYQAQIDFSIHEVDDYSLPMLSHYENLLPSQFVLEQHRHSGSRQRTGSTTLTALWAIIPLF